MSKMSNVLVRGLPKGLYRQIRGFAESENLSVNQTMVWAIREGFETIYRKKNGEAERAEIFRRLDEIREKLRRKYGTFDDSAKLIRKDREGH